MKISRPAEAADCGDSTGEDLPGAMAGRVITPALYGKDIRTD